MIASGLVRAARLRRPARIAGLSGVAAGLGAVIWWRRNPSACPYGQRFFVEAPHPFITRERLLQILEPAPGERLLEVGPGTGYYSLDVAERLLPGGRVDVFDIQQEMLDHTMRQAAARGIDNLDPALGDARDLPYDDGSFTGAFLVTVLGEVPDQDAALRELRRVLSPDGRLVVGELLFDPHYVTLGSLRARADAAGLRFERRVGGRLGYFARFSAR
jgi:ubiquinone/menaquinone biosynthesis C-methylase UbiE